MDLCRTEVRLAPDHPYVSGATKGMRSLRNGSYKAPGVYFPYGLIEGEDGNQVVLYDGHGQLKLPMPATHLDIYYFLT